MQPTLQPPHAAPSLSPPAADDWTRQFTPGRLVCVLALFIAIQYPEVVFGTHSLCGGDYGLFTYPVVHYARESLWRGEIPLWTPLLNCGVPFLAQWNTAICYPLSWLCFLLPLPWSLSLFCFGHLLLAGLGMYALAHRWTENRFAASIAGLSFALNGLTFNCLIWTSNLAALSWLPWVVLTAERGWREGSRGLWLAALAGGMQMLTGAPEIILMTWLLAGTLWLGQLWRQAVPFRLSARRLGLLVAVIGGLASVQLLPFFELLRYSDRQPGFAGGDWSMPAWGWANLVVPLFRCCRSILGSYYQVEQQWTSSYYLGIGVLGLALAAAVKVRRPRVWWLAAAALFGMVIALGDNAFLYGAVKRLFPQLGLARYPIKFLVPTVFAVPLLAGFAAAWAQREPEPHQPAFGKSLVVTALFLAVSIGVVLGASRVWPYPGESWQVTWCNGLERAVFLMLIFGAVWLQARATRASRRAALGFGILLLLGLDVLTHAPRQNATVANRAYGPVPIAMSARPSVGRSRAMLSPPMEALLGHVSTPNPLEYYAGMRCALFMNCNLLDGVPKLTGFCSLYLRDEAAVRPLLYNPTNFPAGLADFLGVSQVLSPTVLFQWTSRDTALPWVTGGQQPIFASPAATLKGLAAADFNPRRQVFLPVAAQTALTATNRAEVEITSASFAAHRVSLAVSASQPALVVIAQTWYPAWRAFVDNREARLWQANGAFQALEVPPGRHQVRLVYRDWFFYAGAAITAVSLVACWLGLRRRRSNAPG